MRYPDFKTKALTLSYDDGVEQDATLIKILDKAGIKCTFNLNSNKLLDKPQKYASECIQRILTHNAAISLYKNSGHEVAVHTLDHPFPSTLSTLTATEQIYQDRKNLEDMFEVEVRGMAYPYGQYTDTIIEVAKNCGIVYSRTTVSTHSFTLPSDWMRLPATCRHKDPQLMELADKFLKQNVSEQPILFYLWGHSYEFEADDNWHIIEDFCTKMGGHKDIWYATNIEIHDYIEAFKSLRFSADGEYVFNPTCIPVNILVCDQDKKQTIYSGERIKL